MVKLVKQNWPLGMSAMAFFCLFIRNHISVYLSILIAVSVIVMTKKDHWMIIWQRSSVSCRIISIFSSLGICLAARDSFFYWWGINTKTLLVTTIGMVVGMFFVLVCSLAFFEEITRIFLEIELFSDTSRLEYVIYGILILTLFSITVAVFSRSDAFYRTKWEYDVIYSSDSPSLMKTNAYLNLSSPENDIRQPLFAVFSAPFLGISYILGKILGSSATMQAIALNCGQIVMFLLGSFLLAKAMKLKPKTRICFMLLSFCTYTQLLFSLMMEQYIVAYFWLMLCICQICEKGKTDRLVMWGAGGTLLTSMILIPAVSEKHPLKQFKAWFSDIMKCGLGFLMLMLAFSRFVVFYNMAYSVSILRNFTGQKTPILDKLYQYTEFVRNIFVAPDAGMNTTAVDHISWQLHPVTALNWVGIGILALCLVSFVWNRKNKSSRVAAFWVVFSVIMLLVLGWGTRENGLILYSLYFGWAFLVLLFQLVEKLESILHIPHLTVVCGVAASVGLLAVNIPAILEMVRFAIAYYPV